MSKSRPDPIDDDLNPGEYGFSDPAPEKRQAPPTKHDKYALSESDDPPEEEERPRRRKRHRNDGDPRDEPRPPKRRRDLATESPPEVVQKSPWWVWTIALTVVGLVGIAAAAVYVGVKEGAAVGGLALAGGLAAVVFETVVVAALLVFIGLGFGIDYGPVAQAIPRLIGCVVFVNGFTLGLGLVFTSCAGPLGILMAMSTVTLVAFVVFQAQFQLNMYEALVTVFVIQGCAWVMAAGLGFAFMNAVR
jgi:hypothetical protein